MGVSREGRRFAPSSLLWKPNNERSDADVNADADADAELRCGSGRRYSQVKFFLCFIFLDQSIFSSGVQLEIKRGG